MPHRRHGRKQKSLTAGRPPLAAGNAATLSSKATRTVIRRHHTLHKEHAKALKAGESELAERIEQQIQEHGGLSGYQRASQTGQTSARGGDTSRVLVSWLSEHRLLCSSSTGVLQDIKALEIGCLAPDNAIARCPNIQLERIDLKSTHELILEQDFMQRPLPLSNTERFDIVSLSLVVNFVADARSRGEMLRRTTKFLRTDGVSQQLLPVLFLTLPLPCVTNSRYMTIDLLTRMMASIGYTLRNSKSTTKIFYSLWQFSLATCSAASFKKTELVRGSNRNNFFIMLD